MNPQTIIFDLGGVLLNIDFNLTFKAFDELGVPNFEKLYSQHSADPFFADFEKGKVAIPAFFDKIREICGCQLTDHEIRMAWNALLIGFPKETMDWFDQIRKKYRVFLFSNTNSIHHEWFANKYNETRGGEFENCFVKAYYSHKMGMRKPDLDGYLHIIAEQQLDPATAVFIDDTLPNIEAAQKADLQAIHLPKTKTLMELGL